MMKDMSDMKLDFELVWRCTVAEILRTNGYRSVDDLLSASGQIFDEFLAEMQAPIGLVQQHFRQDPHSTLMKLIATALREYDNGSDREIWSAPS
jgi:hypothetical protein